MRTAAVSVLAALFVTVTIAFLNYLFPFLKRPRP
jgi:hypothetical protein